MEISGLTKEQVAMLDFMWNELETEEEYLTWFSALDERQQKMAEVLMRMVIIESGDEVDLGEMEEAKEVLKQFTLQ